MTTLEPTGPGKPLKALGIAEAVRSACLRSIIDAYEDAGLQGLCEEGRWEAAIGRLRSLDVQRLLEETENARTEAAP